jgi:hypothetical protein
MRTLRLLLLLLLINNSSIAQTPLDLCKKSVNSYCKKAYTLYKPAEWKTFSKTNYDFQDYKIDIYLSVLTKKTFELSDTTYIKKINNHLIKHKISVFEEEEILGDITSIKLEKIKGRTYFAIPVIYYGVLIDTLRFCSKPSNNSGLHLQYTPENDIKIYTFEPQRATTTKLVYSLALTYEALTEGGFKKYFTSVFYLDMKTYKIIEEVNL